jgi:tetratricopeptide (TPR) repeat protein
MNSPSPVQAKITELYFLPRFFIAVFGICIAAMSAWLFPNNIIPYFAITLTSPQPLTAFYLENMNQREPNDTSIQIALIEQYIGLYEWTKADALLSTLALNTTQHDQWVRLEFIKNVSQAYRLPKGPERTNALLKFKEAIPTLLNLTFTPAQESALGNVALKLAAPDTALAFFQKVIKANPNQSAAFYQNIARVALENSEYDIAAQFYLEASAKQTLIELKRVDVIEALKAYQAGNLMAKGITVIATLPDALLDNQAMLIFLTKYAIAANRPDLATDYITRSLFSDGKP